MSRKASPKSPTRKKPSPPSSRLPYLRMRWIDAQLRDQRYPSARDIADKFEVDARTIYRDIEYMKYQMHAPIAYHSFRRGYCYNDPTYSLPGVKMSEGELVAIFLAEKVLKQYSGTPYEGQLRSAFEKICDSLPEEITVDFRSFDDALSFDPGPLREVDLGMFNLFSDAAANGKQLRIRYYTQSRDEENERVIDPYHIQNYMGDWYVVAFCHRRNEFRDFLLSRVRHAEPTGDVFLVKGDFNLQDYLRQSFGIEKGSKPMKFVIHFDPYQARWIRELKWGDLHTAPKIQNHKDGSLTLSFSSTGIEEVKRWVMKYGSHATVVRPKKLREMVVEEIEMMRRNYERDDGMTG